ncbi:MAG: fructosamine kinase family protein [Pseudomonadota bacterium]
MNTALAHVVAAALGCPDSLAVDSQPVGGGDSHSAAMLTFGNDRCFVKSNQRSFWQAFKTEADALDAIEKTATVRVPAVLGCGHTETAAWLALEWLDLAPLNDAAASRLGTQLAELHRTTDSEHGWPGDNWIGGAVQKNARTTDWPSFWMDQRLAPQIDRLRASSSDASLLRIVEQAADASARLLQSHAPQPSLLHGDLWGGNAARDQRDGAPVIFDPASYFGDRETDVAMTRLFGGFPPSFYDAYARALPPDDGHEKRIALYNLYHALNHANLFGAGYAGMVVRHAEQIVD